MRPIIVLGVLSLLCGCAMGQASSSGVGGGGEGGGDATGQGGGSDATGGGDATGQGGGSDAAGGGAASGGGAGGGIATGGGWAQGGGGGDIPDAGDCTPLSGTVTSLQKGTYCVVGDVIIPTGTTLEVPPGTTFIVMGRYHFGRDPSIPDREPSAIPGSGSLHAIGTAAEPIVFRGVTPNVGWYGIVISHTHDTVHLEHVTIRDTRKDDTNPSSRIWRRGGGLGSYVNAKGTIIRHCSFINNYGSSVAGALDINSHGSWPNAGVVEITDTLFEDNHCDCVSYSGSSTDLCGGGAIRFSHVGGDANLVKVERNTFRNNGALKTGSIDAYGGAIGGFDSSVILGPGNAFVDNQAGTGDGAISCAGQPRTGLIIKSVDPSVTFSGSAPDNGCGQ